MDRKQVELAFLEAVQKSRISNLKKNRIERIFSDDGPRIGQRRRQTLQDRILDEVTDYMIAEQLVVVTEDGVEAAIDWNSLISALERIIPIILQLITLFGG